MGTEKKHATRNENPRRIQYNKMIERMDTMIP